MKTTSPFLLLSLALSLATRAFANDFAVINTNPTGPGSFAQAINDANALPGADRVVFNIPGSGVRTIDVSQNNLPEITDTLTIDGYTQPDAAPNTLALGSNAVVLIQIDGADYATTYPNFSAPTGLIISADGCVVRGLMITRFNIFQFGFGGGGQLGGYGIAIGADHCVIEGNFIGTDGLPANDLGNRQAGIFVSGDNMIGGNTPAARNVIGGNSKGILVQAPLNAGADRVRVAGNQIGTNPSSAGSGIVEGRSNTVGIALTGSFTDTIIGGTDASSANLISGNGTGIRTAFSTTPGPGISGNGVVMKGNFIGLQPNRMGSEQVNQTIGIEILGSNNLIGGLEPGAGNQIAFNETGILVRDGAMSNAILSNPIHSNSNIGIDLAPPTGPTSNDFGDGDSGPNRLQNFPIVAFNHSSGSETSFTGELNSAPSSTFTVQLLGNLEGDQQQRLLNTQTVLTDANGFASFSAIYPGLVEASSVTATATDALGNTSELMPPDGPVQLANISTRAVVGTGDRIMIAGFIIRPASQKKVAVRALGPSLAFPDRLDDPYLEIRDQSGALLAKNDDWGGGGQQQELMDSGLTPASSLESAIVISLPQGNYTAQVSGAHGETGTGIVEIYDLGAWPADSGRLANLSTRGQVGLNDDALIGGFIVRGDAQARVIVRAIGPDLSALGVPDALQDPMLELRNRNGTLLALNDDWREGGQEQEIENTQLAPMDERDSAIVASLFPGNFTAIVRGKNGETGLALVEFYDLTP